MQNGKLNHQRDVDFILSGVLVSFDVAEILLISVLDQIKLFWGLV